MLNILKRCKEFIAKKST